MLFQLAVPDYNVTNKEILNQSKCLQLQVKIERIVVDCNSSRDCDKNRLNNLIREYPPECGKIDVYKRDGMLYRRFY